MIFFLLSYNRKLIEHFWKLIDHSVDLFLGSVLFIYVDLYANVILISCIL